MWILAARNLRTRPTRTLFTVLAIALGVGMIFAMRIVAVAVEVAATQARSAELAGADLEVAGAQGGAIAAGLALTMTAQPGVAAAAPVYRRLEGALDPNVTLDPLGLNNKLKG